MTVKKKVKKMSKAAFVRKCPVDWPAGQVVMDAKNNGIALTEGYVYNIRSTAKAKANGGPQKPSTKGSVTTVFGTPTDARNAGKVEQLLLALGAEMGLVNAIALLEGERARVRAVIS